MKIRHRNWVVKNYLKEVVIDKTFFKRPFSQLQKLGLTLR